MVGAGRSVDDMQNFGDRATPDLEGKPEARIVMEIVGDDESAGWCIVRQGEAIQAGAAEGGLYEVTKTAVTKLLSMDGFRDTTTYVGHRKIRLLLHGVYPNVVKSPSEACVPPHDLSLARKEAMTALNEMNDRNRQLEQKRERRRAEAKRKKYVENRLMTRLRTAVQVSLPASESVAGIAWLAEDGRHAVHPLKVELADSRIAELWALAYLLKAINAGRLLHISMPSRSAASLFLNRHHIISRPHVYPKPLIEVLTVLDEFAIDRDIIVAEGRGGDGRLLRTASQLAEFARKLHQSGGEESPEQWREIDTILMLGIGYDRNAARRAKK